jgi:BirA family biotin operon repressor/biotin-[acetyl-CoA-carboxylase] ligase
MTAPPAPTPTSVASGSSSSICPTPRRIDAPRLADLLGEITRDWSIEIVETTGSTNADLMASLKAARALASPLAGPQAVQQVRAAYAQTAGRGRRGRPWLASAGDALLFSVAYTLPCPAAGLAGLSLAVGTAIVAGLRRLPLDDPRRLSLKWPNDVLLDGAKLAGVLLETGWTTPSASAVVIGIGINLHGAQALAAQLDALDSAPTRRNAPTALVCALPQLDMTEVFANVLNALGESLERFSTQGFAPFRQVWTADHAFAGQQVTLLEHDVEIAHGAALGVDARGQLLIDSPDGVRAIASGDVSLRLA